MRYCGMFLQTNVNPRQVDINGSCSKLSFYFFKSIYGWMGEIRVGRRLISADDSRRPQKSCLEIETAPYFSFLCFSPTPTNNKSIKTIKTKGRGCGETHTPRPVGEMWLYSNPPRIGKMEKRMGVGYGVQFPFSIACNHKIQNPLATVYLQRGAGIFSGVETTQ